MTGGHDSSTEASNEAFQDDPGQNTNAWSLLYADAPLKPTSCADCGNVFATDSTSCPWCGRIVVSSERSAPPLPVAEPFDEPGTAVTPAATPTTDAAEASLRTSAEATAAYRARQGRTAENAAGLRRWASLLLAAAILLIIATGLTIRARNNRTSDAVPTLTTVPRTTASTSATTAVPDASTTATTAVADASTTVAATDATSTSTATAATTVAPTTVTTAGSSFTAEQQQAFDLAQSLSTALATKNWSRVRELTGATAVTDAQLDAVYGPLTKVELVPAKVDKLTESTYDVFAGVVQVKSVSGAVSSTIYCNRYSIDLLAKTVSNIKSQQLRTQSGDVEAGSVATELGTTCLAPSFG